MMIFPDSSSVLCTTAWLLLFLWLQAQVHQRRNGQNVVRRNILEEELQALAEYHKETLLAESNVSTIRYRPITMNGQIPLTSSCTTHFFWALLLLATFLNFSFKYRVSLQIVALFPYFLTVFKLGFQGDFIEKISYAWLSIRKLFK